MKDRVIFLDTETTGLDTDNCGVYQIAGLIDIDGKTVEEINIFTDIFQDDVIEEGVYELHGEERIKEIATYQRPLRAHAELCKALGKYVDRYDPTDKLIAIAYVADFDNRVLRRFFKKNKDDYFGNYFWHPFICVMNLAAYMYQDKRHLFENFKLGTVAHHLGIDIGGRPLHDGMVDVCLTREIYYKLTT